MKLDPRGLRAFVDRDWAATERLDRDRRARLPVEEKVRIAIALYEAARSTKPGWPDAATRNEDLATHLRLRGLLDRAPDVGRR